MRSTLFATSFRLFLALGCIAIAACGGGTVGSSGTGVAPLGVAVGTVNGFGNVIVDGVRIDDRRVAAVAETAPGTDTTSEVQLGDRVEVTFASPGVAGSLRVDATLAGAVSKVVNASQFEVLGQTVEVNATSSAGPVSQFAGGYLSGSDLRAGDVVEVHGLIVRRGAGYVIQATRIEKRWAVPTYLKVTGLISNLGNGGAAVFKLGELGVDASAAAVLPAGRTLANGQEASILALPSTLTAAESGVQALRPSQVRLRSLPASSNDATVSGSIAALDATAHSFQLAGLLVRYANATITPSAMALTDNKYVRVRGKLQADGSLSASAVTVRDGRNEPEAELKGSLQSYDPTTQTFTIRDVKVDASYAAMLACFTTGLVNGLYVEVAGSLGPTGVIATTVQCGDEPRGASIGREGVSSTVNADANTFVLTLTGTSAVSVTVSWNAQTYFRDVAPYELDGKTIGVEGNLVNGVLVASKIKLEE